MRGRARAGGIVLLLSVCLSAGYQLGYISLTPEPEEREASLVAEYDGRRFQGLADALPPGGVVGYVADDPDGPEATQTYYLAQYVLAPCILVRGDRQRLVLVDDPPGRPARPEMAGRRLLRDLDNGVRLYDREEPR